MYLVTVTYSAEIVDLEATKIIILDGRMQTITLKPIYKTHL
jgi:hypothetical protein